MHIKRPSIHQVKLAITILTSHFLLRLLQIYDFQTTSYVHAIRGCTCHFCTRKKVSSAMTNVFVCYTPSMKFPIL
jgi:hypothetical protein